MAIDLDEYKKLYFETSNDLLKVIKEQANVLKNDYTDREALTEIHRASHSLKSQSLVMGYTQIGLVGRILESLFLYAKNNKLVITDTLMHHINNTIQAIEESLTTVKNGSSEKNMSQYISALEENTTVKLLD